ncbi:probable inactive poly [ADP-ribose] polymerase SRO2 [Tanacetum coccineum]
MDRIASYKHQAASLLEDQVSVVVEDHDIVRANDSDDESVTSCPRFGIFAKDELMVDRLEEGNHDYDILKESFLNYDKSVMDVARFDAFKVYASAVASRNSGEANIRYGWYGGSRDEICEILKHGFRRFTNKTMLYGRGVCLSPANSPTESFKSINPIEGEQANIQGSRAVRIPTSPHMSINGLIRQLTNYLSSSKMASIKKLHQAYSMKRISRPAFIRCLRANAGDDVLRADRYGGDWRTGSILGAIGKRRQP